MTDIDSFQIQMCFPAENLVLHLDVLQIVFSDYLNEVDDCHHEVKTDWEVHEDNEEHKDTVVPCSDTVVDPGAVVVEPFHAVVASAAVPAPWSSDNHTVGTDKYWVY